MCRPSPYGSTEDAVLRVETVEMMQVTSPWVFVGRLCCGSSTIDELVLL